jgi:hypothetical protein
MYSFRLSACKPVICLQKGQTGYLLAKLLSDHLLAMVQTGSLSTQVHTGKHLTQIQTTCMDLSEQTNQAHQQLGQWPEPTSGTQLQTHDRGLHVLTVKALHY